MAATLDNQTNQKQPTERHTPRWVRWLVGRNPSYTLLRAALLVALVAAVYQFVLLPVRVSGISMEPTCHDGQLKLVNRLAYLTHPPRHGDIVAIWYRGHQQVLLKRVLAVPGETVAFRQGRLFINGQPVEEPYVRKRGGRWDYPGKKLGPDEFFLVGDNRSMPAEDHYFGAVPRGRIIGKVLF